MAINKVNTAAEAVFKCFCRFINNFVCICGNTMLRRRLALNLCVIARLLMIFAVAGVTVLCPIVTAFPAAVADDPASIEILPAEGIVGTSVYVKILDYTPDKQVIVTFGTGTTIGEGTSVGTKTYVATKATTDSSGYAVADFEVDIFPAGRYIIMADDGTNRLTAGFKLIPSINLQDDVVSGCVGDVVSVDGFGFAASKLVYLGVDDEKIVTGETDEKGQCLNMRLVIPPCSRGNHDIKMKDSDSNEATAPFNIRQQVSISPDTATVGNDVTIVGTGFGAVADVTAYFDDQAVGVVQTGADGGFTTIITIPPCGDGTHRIKVDDMTNKGFKDIHVSSTMSISPNTGFIGMQVGLQGAGFRPGFPVNLSYDNIELEGTTVQAQGGFTQNFKIPVSRAGAHTVVASDGINTQKVTFTVESTPPMAPVTQLPADGDRAVKDIHFEWGPVSDPSGVTYTFEVADDAQFTNVIMSQANLKANYIDITEDSKMLPGRERPYYWRVKAVDRAQNEGQWSLASSFYKGHTFITIVNNMPEWVKWVLIALGLMLFGFMFFWIGHTIKKLRNLDEDDIDDEGYVDDEIDYNTGNEWMQR